MTMRIGVDIGGTKISAALIRGQHILKSVTVPTPQNRAEILHTVTAGIQQVWDSRIRAIGVGVAGVVDRGKVANTTALASLNGTRLGVMITKKFKRRCVVENDANCFALAEYHHGKQRANPLVGVTLGTGVGMGIVINGKIFRGAHGAAGECSHIPYGEGIWDQYGERFLIACARKRKLHETSRVLAMLAAEGNRKALRVFADYGTGLGKALSVVVNTIDPATLVIGGGIGHAYPFFAPAMKVELRKWVYPHVFRKLKILQSKMKDAGVVGAGMLA